MRAKGYEVSGCLNASDAYDEMYGRTFDAIIADIMMPDIDGFEFAETVRKLNENIPILFMTAKDDFASKQKGFMAGVDDYLVKSVDLDEMDLHLGALLRRAKIASNKKLTFGSLIMDTDERTAVVNGEEIPLTQREFNLLFKLLSYPKKTFTRSQLMDEFWDVDSETTPRAVDVWRYVIIFLLIAFVVSVSFLLFFHEVDVSLEMLESCKQENTPQVSGSGK